MDGRVQLKSKFPSLPIDMDENSHHPYEINSFHVNKVLHANVVDLNKKRKMLDEQLGLPLPKHKFRDRSYGSEQVSPFPEDPEAEEVLHTCTIKGNINRGPMDDVSEHHDSAKDSNSFIGESDTAMSQFVEVKCEPEFPNVCANDRPAKFKLKIPKANAYDQPSTSSGSWGNNHCTNTISSLDSRVIKNASVNEEESSYMGRQTNTIIPEGGLHFEPGSEGPKEKDPGFGKYAYEIEDCLDVVNDEMMLYSNGATPDLFVLSSGRWNINQDAQLGERKPTIDQEFEQYFSMLML